MRRALPVLLLVAALILGLAWFRAPLAAALNLPWLAPAAGNGPRLRTVAVDRGPLTAAVSATGALNPLVTVSVGSQLSGQIRELLADFNTRVRAGQPIARLNTEQLEARRAAADADLLAARAAVAVAQAAAEKAAAEAIQARASVTGAEAGVANSEAALRDSEYEARRTTELQRSATGTARDAVRAGFAVERARADLASARSNAAQMAAARDAAAAAARTALAQVEAAEAAASQKAALLRQVEVDLGFATIRSPIEGVVVSRNVDLGQTVAASFQAPVLFQIAASLDEMEVWATVDEADIGRVRPGQDVPFTVAAFPGENFSGRVKEVRLAATTVSNVVTYTVVVTVANPGGRLLPGMTATLRIVTDQRADAVRVPNAALRWRPPGAAAPPGTPTAGGPPGGGPIEAALRELPDLSPAQREELTAAAAEMRERMAAIPRNSEGRAAQMAAARQRLAARLNAALTPEQRARLAEARNNRGSAGQVWVSEGGEPPRAVAVRLGLTDGSTTEVLDGALTPGTLVVIGQERTAAAPPAGGRPF